MDQVSVLSRVEAVRRVQVTVDGQPVAELRPLSNRPRWVPHARVAAAVFSADAALREEIEEAFADTVDAL